MIQKDSMDDSLRNTLWNLLEQKYWHRFSTSSIGNCVRGSNMESLVFELWLNYFKRPIDAISNYWPYCLSEIRDYFFKADWREVYDFIEAVSEFGQQIADHDEFERDCNEKLAQEHSAYRFVNGRIVDTVSRKEIEEIDKALQETSDYELAQEHLENALRLIADRNAPDYEQSVCESILAVRTLLHEVRNGALKRKMIEANENFSYLRRAFLLICAHLHIRLEQGKEPVIQKKLSNQDAWFILVSSSVFMNYLIAIITSPKS